MFAARCGAGQPAGLSDDLGMPTTDSGAEAPSAASTTARDSGVVEQFASPDASSAGGTLDCKPGTYAGPFETHVTSDAGGLFDLLSLDFEGTLSVAIVGQVVQTTGELPQTTHSIAPGAKLAGVDESFGGSYRADLTGQLDCANHAFAGTLNGTYEFALDAGSIPLQGTLSGAYAVGDAGAPELTGSMTLTSTQVPTLGAEGPWTAILQ